MSPITFEQTIKIEIVDADKTPIHLGSVIQRIDEPECRGVVTRINLPGAKGLNITTGSVGDIYVRTNSYSGRFSNQYNKWRHIPQKEQTHEERYYSWLYGEFWHDTDSQISKDEQFAMSGIIALLPENFIKWETNYPMDIQDTLHYLMKYLTELKEGKK